MADPFDLRAFKGPVPKLPQSGGIGRKKPASRRRAGSARWAELRERKLGPCRVCRGGDGGGAFPIQLHHLVPRAQLGADTESNLVPLCRACHDRVTRRDKAACAALRESLSDEEYSYATERLGESLFESYYPVVYERG